MLQNQNFIYLSLLMVATVDSFEIRKFSNKLEDNKDWIHYPHRSDLLINFVLDENQARISITWRTQTLVHNNW